MTVPTESGATPRDGADAADSPFRRRWSWRTRVAVTLAGWAIALVLRLLYRTLRVRCLDPAGVLDGLARGERALFAFWHDTLVLLPLMVTAVYPRARVAVMLSWHRDAEIAAQAVRRLGIRAVRGSSTRGWLGALRGLLGAHARGEVIAVVPDGPRGPRHHAQGGIVQLARATGLPIVVIGAAARPARRLGSWDRLQLPAPFARVALVLGAPLAVPDGAGGDETARAAVEAALARATDVAAAAVGVRVA
ncbi:MAG: DUF374 domain-containing protein [Deltaproteobacteria bacterium]|nr:MAG: DUF374 domain-containing protein [Deltaproteobacteria bacterium]